MKRQKEKEKLGRERSGNSFKELRKKEKGAQAQKREEIEKSVLWET